MIDCVPSTKEQSMKTTKKWVVFNKCRTNDFIVKWLIACQNWYRNQVEAKKQLFHFPYKMDQLIWLYDYSFKRGYINISFEAFKEIVRGYYDPQQALFHKEKKRSGRNYQLFKNHNFGWCGRHIVCNRYRKRAWHGVKDPEKHSAKKLWREVSGKDRDSRKKRKSDYSRSFYKKLKSKEHRAWIKHEMHRRNYDAFHAKERNAFVPWWDYY
jgi:hypothetical protein